MLSNFLTLEKKWKSTSGNFKQAIPLHLQNVAVFLLCLQNWESERKTSDQGLIGEKESEVSGKMFSALSLVLLTNQTGGIYYWWVLLSFHMLLIRC